MLNIPLSITPLSNSEFETFFSTPEMKSLIKESSLAISSKYNLDYHNTTSLYKETIKFLWNDIARDASSFHNTKNLGEFVMLSVFYTDMKIFIQKHKLTEPKFYMPIILPKEEIDNMIKIERVPAFCSLNPEAIKDFMSNDIKNITTDLSTIKPEGDLQILPLLIEFIQLFTNFKLEVITNSGSNFPASIYS